MLKTNRLTTFQRLVEMLFCFSNLSSAITEETKSIAVSLYDHWLESDQIQNPDFEIEPEFEQFSEEKRMKILIEALHILDPTEELRHLVLSYSVEDLEDFESSLAGAIQKGHLKANEGYRIRMIVLNAYALAFAFVLF
jgi:hypothetical protein